MGSVESISRRSGTLAVFALVGLASFVSMFVTTKPIMYGVTAPVNYIAYWHIALAWTGGLALLVTFLASVQFLRTRNRQWNLIAHGAGEGGFIALTATLVMGSIWGSEMWGTYWTWSDVRLVTIFITWLIYLGYHLVFLSTRDGEGRFAAVYGIVGFVTIPLSYLSTRLWNPTFHSPTIGGSTGATVINPVALLLAIGAATILLGYLGSLRLRIHKTRDVVIRQRGGGD
ncbi:MAG: heme exporter protein C [Halobacteriales archaeon]|jgi:heme exporter protein C